jgi:hypothetical protein
MAVDLCNPKDCFFYKVCKQRNDPYKYGAICSGYEAYINQDIFFEKGSQFEIPFTDAKINEQKLSSEDFPAFDCTHKDNWFEIMRLFFFERLSPKEISKRVECSQQRVYVVVRDCKRILLQRVKRKTGRKKKVQK